MRAISYSLLADGCRNASSGDFLCDRIEVSREHFEQIVDMILMPTANPAEGRLEYSAAQLRWRREALAGEVVVMFIMARLMDTPDMGNSIRFVNIGKPDLTHTVEVGDA